LVVVFGWRDMCDEHAPGEADLWCGEADARCVLHEVDHALGDLGDDGVEGCRSVVVCGWDGQGAGAEGGVGVVEDAERGWACGFEVGC